MVTPTSAAAKDKPASQPNKSDVEYSNEVAAQRSEPSYSYYFSEGDNQNDSDAMEMGEGLFVHFPDRQVQVEEWRNEAQQFETEFSEMEMKIHRFPASLRVLGGRYIRPMAVGIGYIPIRR